MADSAGNRAVLHVEMTDKAGQPRNFVEVTAALIGPDLQVRESPLPQVGAGLYEAQIDLGEPGAYLIRVAAKEGTGSADAELGQQILGLVVPYSPEYRAAASAGADRTLLETLARRTGGGELPDPLAAFVHNLPTADRAQEIWRGLLLVVTLLFPLDVALRRVMLGPGDVRKAWARLRERLSGRLRTAARPEQPVLGRLFEAQRRGRERTRRERQDATARRPPQESVELPAQPPGTQPPPRESQPPAALPDDDALARLREAKRRARRRR
jgi:hypothetical protein